MAGETKAHSPSLCSRFHHASELIGRKWTGAIIYLLLRERCRFATLRAAIPDITDRMLSERLQELEEEGIVDRIVVPEAPIRVEYALTAKGRGLTGAIDAIGAWATEWIPENAARGNTRRPRSTRRPAASVRRSRATRT